MAGSSGSLHENEQSLAAATIDRHRAIVSIMEELEAIDWYDQRVDAATDADVEIRSHTGACVLVVDSGLLEMHHDGQWRTLRERHPAIGTVVRCWVPRNPGMQRAERGRLQVHPDDDESLIRAVRALCAAG